VSVRFEINDDALKAAVAVLHGEKAVEAWEPEEYQDLRDALSAALRSMFAEDEYEGIVGPSRRKLPATRDSLTHKFAIANISGGVHEGYITAGRFGDGELGEIFLTDVGKEGSTLRGIMDAFAICFSISLQHGASLSMMCRKLAHMKFEPRGKTNNPDIPEAQSIPDYIARWLALRFGDRELQEELRLIGEEMKG
jgi:ribonucleoside-diphosphate reductase alpha chain